ncbi:MAG TPA: YqaE/Pmp3 family membrane protein [Phototrophicaceae bacterium]|nr:YqaE/Pmp3 family membrane protein [Phototrophicaceae bacterium]
MAPWRIVMALIFPPFAVIDKGCGAFALVCLLTFPFWIPGIFAALWIISRDNPSRDVRYVDVPAGYVPVPREDGGYEKPKRKGAYVHLEDGDVLEVIDDDNRPLRLDDQRHAEDEY